MGRRAKSHERDRQEKKDWIGGEMTELNVNFSINGTGIENKAKRWRELLPSKEIGDEQILKIESRKYEN